MVKRATLVAKIRRRSIDVQYFLNRQDLGADSSHHKNRQAGWNIKLKKKSGGWMGGWVDGLITILRIDYSNKKQN